jgi:hypothetical protein
VNVAGALGFVIVAVPFVLAFAFGNPDTEEAGVVVTAFATVGVATTVVVEFQFGYGTAKEVAVGTVYVGFTNVGV